ncbi:MAG: hypothetical protein JRH19_18560 [Deltaproteobacteria bacterium]|nr:hypothetical protein [Deltaproteobacteria bacterium]
MSWEDYSSSMIEYSNSPILLDGVIDDLDAVVDLFERSAPHTPLGGWFRPDRDGGEATSAMWFQTDWMHLDFVLEGAEIFARNERVIEAARAFCGAEVVVPHTVYVNLMAAIGECGPAHTDNPVFRGRNRSNTPMMLLRTMLWSGLFERWVIPQVTSIWWMNDVEGGGLSYWPEGPGKPPQRHANAMANTALVGDNHGMFHQVEPVGPFDRGTRFVSASAELAPVNDGSGDWAVQERAKECYRAPFGAFRASVLWKADVYASEEERRRVEQDLLSIEEVARIFDEDLARRGEELRFDLDRLDDPAQTSALAGVYPEAVPVGAGVSIFDVER